MEILFVLAGFVAVFAVMVLGAKWLGEKMSASARPKGTIASSSLANFDHDDRASKGIDVQYEIAMGHASPTFGSLNPYSSSDI